MPAWMPILKIVWPYVAPIIATALPAFTKKRSERADPVVNQQISELQEAVKANAESITVLAKGLEEAVKANDDAMRRTRLLAIVSIGIAFLSFAFTLATRFT